MLVDDILDAIMTIVSETGVAVEKRAAIEKLLAIYRAAVIVETLKNPIVARSLRVRRTKPSAPRRPIASVP